jgi:deoxyribose-phosphate aldolase
MNTINRYIDQTMLRPEATGQDIVTFVQGVKRYRFFAACVNPCWVRLVRAELPRDIAVCSVVGFPLGASSTKAKAYAAVDLMENGCDEIDMVMNIGKLKSKDYKYVGQEIRTIVRAIPGKVLKVIIETCLLTDQEKKAAARIITEKGAHFVKTSTGFSKQGAVVRDVTMLRSIVGPDFGVKASGGIRDYESARMFINAGANRIGTSAGVSIMHTWELDRADKK